MSGVPKDGNNVLTYELPLVVYPPDSVCFVVPVPNEKYYITAFLGAIKDLAEWWHWQRDDAHTAREVAYVWFLIWRNLQAQNCSSLAPCSPMGSMEDLEVPLRVDCNCNVFVPCCDGTEKQLLTQGMQGGQPGAGSPQPAPAGGQATYCFQMGGADMRLLPTLINSGDKLLIVNPNGIWSDPEIIFPYYNAPNGWHFVGGALFNTPSFDPADPMPSVRDGQLIALVNGVYYDVFNQDAQGNPQAWTVPSGIVNAQLEFLMNDHTPAGSQGEIQFCVTVTNNQPVSSQWCDSDDFATSSYGWIVNPAVAVGPSGTYGPGSGWQGDLFQEPAGNYYRGVDLTLSLPSSRLQRVDFTYEILTGGSFLAGSDNAVVIAINGSVVAAVTAGSVALGIHTLTWIGDISAVTSLRVFAAGGYGFSDPGGSANGHKVQISGVGVDPHVGPPC